MDNCHTVPVSTQEFQKGKKVLGNILGMSELFHFSLVAIYNSKPFLLLVGNVTWHTCG